MSGALLIDYVKLWEYPVHKGVYAPSKMSKSSKDDPTTKSEYWQDLLSYTRDSSNPHMWYRTSQSYKERPDFPKLYNFTEAIAIRLKHQNSIRLSGTHRICYDYVTTLSTPHLEEPEYLYAVEAEPKNIFGSIIRQYAHQFFQWENSIITYGYVGQPQAYQETAEDPRKRIIAERFAVLAQREDNWDGYDSKKPTEQILKHAQAVIEGFVDTIISNRRVLLTPFISTDEAGHITVQWNKKPRELHLHITQQESRYLKVWGSNINTEMEEGILNSDKYIMLWEWLTL